MTDYTRLPAPTEAAVHRRNREVRRAAVAGVRKTLAELDEVLVQTGQVQEDLNRLLKSLHVRVQRLGRDLERFLSASD